MSRTLKSQISTLSVGLYRSHALNSSNQRHLPKLCQHGRRDCCRSSCKAANSNLDCVTRARLLETPPHGRLRLQCKSNKKNSKQNFDNLHHTTHLTTLLTTNLLASPQNLFNLFCCKKGDLVALNLHYAATDRTYLFTTSSGDIGLLKR